MEALRGYTTSIYFPVPEDLFLHVSGYSETALRLVFWVMLRLPTA